MTQKIRKAVFPVAGLGTRFLPVTKASPKEMLPIVDKPLIQYAVEEAAAAGITEMIFVTGRSKRAIEDHFDKAYELEAELAAHGKIEALKEIQDLLPGEIRYSYVRQVDALGLGHAVSCARHLVGNEPFAVVLADDLIDADVPALKQMVEAYEDHRCSIVGIQQIARHETNQYGVIRAMPSGPRRHRIVQIVEKPASAEAPSTLGVVGRYIFTPHIFDYLAEVTPGKGGEIQLTDAIQLLLDRRPVLGYEFRGTRYDCGSKLGYVKATVAYGLKHPAIAEEFTRYMSELSLPSDERKTA